VAAIQLLAELMLLRCGPDGMQLRPAAFRYRHAVAKVAQPSLFADAGAQGAGR